MMAPSPAGGDAGGDQSDQGNGDACDAHQQLDPPSKRHRLEELREYYRHKRQKIQEQQNDMSTLGYSTNHDYGWLGDEPESQMLSESQAHHQPGESSSAHSSPTASSGFPNAIQQQPISLNTDQPGDGENSEDDRDFGPGGDDEYANYDCDGDGEYSGDNISPGGDEDRQSAHREAGHGRHRDQDHAESANDMPFMAHPSPTLRVRGDIARDRARPASSAMTIQPEQPRLDAYPPEDSESGTDSTSLAGDEDRQLLPSASGSNISYRQARSREFRPIGATRRKIQETEHGMHRDTPSETESGAQPHFRPQQVVEDTSMSIRLNSPAVTTTPDEPSSVHSFPDLVVNASLDADPAADDSEDDSEDDDRKRQKILQAKIKQKSKKINKDLKEAKECLEGAKKAEMDLERRIRALKAWQQNIEGVIQNMIEQRNESFRSLGDMEKDLDGMREKTQSARRDVEEKRQDQSQMEQGMQQLLG
ncbi:hypothetical protein CEP54_015960 [Fusarium duplospermum]|uniref:Uncharacterized protein n=1 Tax=Fusarium duplospermum TaxID=1325734 RepID=A0A428NJH8_9HYPO|nr:hypothetical protein CEP54_015960 [Fusarium duplospermum]